MPVTSKEIGARIQKCRKALGLTQAELAERVKLDTAYLSQVERGWKTPSLDTLLVLAGALHVQPGTLLNSAPGKKDQLASEIEALVKKWPPRKRKAVLQALRILAR